MYNRINYKMAELSDADRIILGELGRKYGSIDPPPQSSAPPSVLELLSPEERLEYNAMRMRIKNAESIDENRFRILDAKINKNGGRSKPSKKRSTHRRRRSSKARKARATRRK